MPPRAMLVAALAEAAIVFRLGARVPLTVHLTIEKNGANISSDRTATGP